MTRQIKVLVIEDDSAIRGYLCEMLECAGFEVRGCEDGLSALEAAREHFHVIIVDYQMPSMTGIEATKHLRMRFPDGLIIGVSSDDKKAEFLDVGANAFFQKPYAAGDIVNLIRSGSG